MFSGDSLTVLAFLVGALLTSMIGAISAPTGWRSQTLWWLAALFGIASVAWLLAPTASPVFAAIKPVAVALVESNALAMVGIVGIVALMVGGRPSTGAENVDLAAIGKEVGPQLPAFAAGPTNRSKWAPDLTFQQAMGYLGSRSSWAGQYRTVSDTSEKLISELMHGKITAWGKAHPNDKEEYQIQQAFWLHADVTFETSYAFSRNRGVPAYDIRLSEREIKFVWPPKTGA